MKKIMISLMMVVAATTTSFAKSNNTDVTNAVKIWRNTGGEGGPLDKD
jgi:hypothetical protein